MDIKFKENKILSYYDIKLSNAGWLDGDHLGWCIDNNGKPVGFNPAKLVSSYNSDPTVLADIVPNPDNLDLLNYLMNTYDYENKFKLVQSAIWILMNGEHKNGTGGIDWLYPAERDERDAIVAEVKANGEGYVPGCDDKLVVLIDSGDRDKWQNCFMLIPNKIPPYKDETAWAKGDRFVTRGSWAMYFHLNL